VSTLLYLVYVNTSGGALSREICPSYGEKLNNKHSDCFRLDPCFVGHNDVYIVNVGAKPRAFETLTNRRYEDE